jgi:hypothetical protein
MFKVCSLLCLLVDIRVATPFQELDVVRPEHSGGFLGGLLGFFGQLGDMLEDVMGATTRGESNRRPIRELFPRQPFHDTQIKITGVAASDISSFFIQVTLLSHFHSTASDLTLCPDTPLLPSTEMEF